MKSIYWKNIKEGLLTSWPYVILIIFALFVLKTQFSNRAFFLSNDSLFHVNQFYESAMQIKTGQFNWFLNLFGFGQTGRIVNAIYGPVFSYLIGALLLVTGTWFRAQMILEFIVTVLSGAFMYHLLRDLHINQAIAIMLGIIYASSFPIMEYVELQTFEGVGNVFIPLVIMLGIRMWKRHRIPLVSLAILLAVLIQIHILTALVAALALIPFAIVSFKLNHHKLHWIGQLGSSIGLCLLLTGNIWALMLNLFHSNYIIKPFPNENFSRNALAFNNGQLTLVGNLFIFLGLLFVIILIFNWRDLSWSNLFIPLLALVYTFISSAYFPWNELNRLMPAIGQLFQFPFRFLGVAVTLFLVAIGQGTNQLLKDSNRSGIKKTLSSFVLLALLILTCGSMMSERQAMNGQVHRWNNGHYFKRNYHLSVSKNQIKASFNRKYNLGLAPHYLIKPAPDYLPSNRSLSPRSYFRIAPYTNTMVELFRDRPIHYASRAHSLVKPGHFSQSQMKIESNPALPHFHKLVQNHQLVMRWRQPKLLNNKYTILPAVKYHNTQMKMDHRMLPHVRITKVGAIALKPSAGYHQVTISYHPARLVSIMMILTVVSWLILIAGGIFRAISKFYLKFGQYIPMI